MNFKDIMRIVERAAQMRIVTLQEHSGKTSHLEISVYQSIDASGTIIKLVK